MDIRRNPFDEMERAFEQMRRNMMASDPAFGAAFGVDADARTDEDRMDASAAGRQGLSAAGRRDTTLGLGDGANLTVEREDDAYLVLADIPGFETEEIDLRFEDGILTITAKSETDEEREGVRSRRSRSVRESLRVPDGVAVEEIEATYRNGVLEVRLPAEAGSTDGHQIDVQ